MKPVDSAAVKGGVNFSRKRLQPWDRTLWRFTRKPFDSLVDDEEVIWGDGDLGGGGGSRIGLRWPLKLPRFAIGCD